MSYVIGNTQNVMETMLGAVCSSPNNSHKIPADPRTTSHAFGMFPTVPKLSGLRNDENRFLMGFSIFRTRSQNHFPCFFGMFPTVPKLSGLRNDENGFSWVSHFSELSGVSQFSKLSGAAVFMQLGLY
jgi:hypothetical protein